MLRGLLSVLASLALACSTSNGGGGSDDAGGGGGGIDADPGGGSDARIVANPDAAPTAVKFIVMGDVGEGNDAQDEVAAAIVNKCAADGCDFVVLLGDNFYDAGVESVNDPLWETAFEDPYMNVDLPFYAVLGNHDYGGNIAFIDTPGAGNEFDKGLVEVEYAQTSDKWHMPDTFYTLTWGNVGFIMLDTNSVMWDNTDNGDQRAWYPTALAEVSGAEWVFSAGHHPLRSNGAHGNAGTYESIEVAGIEIPIPLPIMDGATVRDFFDEVVCGTVDVSFSGHDHNRQWLDMNDELCGAELIVSGAGAKTKDLQDRGNDYHWQDATTEGFMYVVVDGNSFHGQFIDKMGTVNFEKTITK
jgi:hypothetical protein